MIQADKELDDFTITYRREVIFYLRELINTGERITVVFDEGRENLLTVLLDVDEDANMLIFDWGGSEVANRKLLQGERAYFMANPVGVRNQFASHRFREIVYEGRRAFATNIPEKFIRLQRRQYFRLTLPVTRRPNCRLVFGDEGIAHDWPVVDIGIGGVSLESASATAELVAGEVIPRAVIELGKLGKLEVDLEIRHCSIFARGNKQVGRLGCRFANLTPAQEHTLQRFITDIQREERARLG